MEDNEFLYRPVNSGRLEIRLLIIQPHANRGAPVHCAVKHVSLLDTPRPVYEAVSYTWEDPRARSHIIAEGRLLRIPKSAETCLRHLRYPGRPRTVWIDSGSIHQSDLDERAEQVSIMPEVYSRCLRSVVWLGEDDSQTKSASLEVQSLLREIYSTEDFGSVLRYHHRAPGVLPERVLPGLCALFSRPWFRRLWVVQEVALAPASVTLCGEQEFDTVDLLRIAVWLDERMTVGEAMLASENWSDGVWLWQKFHLSVICAKQMQLHSDKTYGREPPSTLDWPSVHKLLTTASAMNCTDGRDKVFAILGLVRAGGEESVPVLLRPDYRKPVREVYHDATRYLYSIDETISYLDRVKHRSHSDIQGHIPSWTMRWDRTFDEHVDPVSLSCDFNACSGLPLTFLKERNQGKVLRLHNAVFAGQVSWCQKPVNHVGLSFRRLMFSRYRHALGRTNAAATGRLTTSEVWKALACTLVCEVLANNARQPKEALYTAAQCYWSCNRAGPKAMSEVTKTCYSEEHPSATINEASRYATGLLGGWANRRFFLTADGSPGMGPKVMRAEDLVAVVAGFRTPLILRPAGAGYKFIGEAYIHGLMDGEAIGGALEDIDVV